MYYKYLLFIGLISIYIFDPYWHIFRLSSADISQNIDFFDKNVKYLEDELDRSSTKLSDMKAFMSPTSKKLSSSFQQKLENILVGIRAR